jgi:hypothetical protein
MHEYEAKELTDAVRSISHGDVNGPTGLEMLSMAVSGDGLKAPLSGAISDGLHAIAEAIREGLGEIAEAVRKSEE